MHHRAAVLALLFMLASTVLAGSVRADGHGRRDDSSPSHHDLFLAGSWMASSAHSFGDDTPWGAQVGFRRFGGHLGGGCSASWLRLGENLAGQSRSLVSFDVELLPGVGAGITRLYGIAGVGAYYQGWHSGFSDGSTTWLGYEAGMGLGIARGPVRPTVELRVHRRVRGDRGEGFDYTAVTAGVSVF